MKTIDPTQVMRAESMPWWDRFAVFVRHQDGRLAWETHETSEAAKARVLEIRDSSEIAADPSEWQETGL